MLEDCSSPSSGISRGKPAVGYTLSIEALLRSCNWIDPSGSLRLRVKHMIADHFPLVVVMMIMVMMEVINNDNIKITQHEKTREEEGVAPEWIWNPGVQVVVIP